MAVSPDIDVGVVSAESVPNDRANDGEEQTDAETDQVN